MSQDKDQKPEKEAEKAFNRTLKNMLNTPPEKKNGGKDRKKEKNRNN